MSSLRIGVLVDTAEKGGYLQEVVEQAGHQLAYSAQLDGVDPDRVAADDQVHAWVIDVAEHDWDAARPEDLDIGPGERLLDTLLEVATVPIILSDSSEYAPGGEEHQAWLRRMAIRLHRLSSDINLQGSARAPYLWVLAASTGGPRAVQEFLQQLPPDLGVAFLYVQHIDAHYAATLVKMASSAGHYPASLACHGAVLQKDSLALITADQRVQVHENGTLLHANEPWGGRYAPSVDQVAANVARVYGARCGMIVFSGMGDDGVAGARLIKQRGGQVWVQSPASCASDSMPSAVLRAGLASYQGEPEQLARCLAGHLRHIQVRERTWRKKPAIR